jgi:D-alanyl-D-alanine carboxypeptidase
MAGLLRGFALAAAVALGALVALPGGAAAQIGSERYASLIVDARTGRVVSAVNPDEVRHPASLTKVMTLYMVFEALRDRRITLDQRVPVSAYAASMSPTKLGVPPGGRLTVEEAILGLVTRSANDAAAALGEMLGGSEERFARIMTLRARALGMRSTVFRNASGLPDWNQVTTARDMATLARRLLYDFPSEYKYFSTTQFRFRGQVFRNHNHLLDSYPGADGIKTGYINASGFNLVTSATRGNVRLIGVVMGASRGYERDLHMVALLDQGFEKLDVPIAPSMAGRMPSLVSAAQAAPGLAARPMAEPRVVTPRAAAPRDDEPRAVAPARPVVAARAGAPPRVQAPAGWAVQVGAFASEAQARRAAASAQRIVDAGTVRVEPVTVNRRPAFRAQVAGLSQGEVRPACAALTKRKLACMPVRP